MNKIKLFDVYAVAEAPLILFHLLEERDPIANISHKAMPTFEQHMEFFNRVPYDAWYLIRSNGDVRYWVGAIYITELREVGIAIFKVHQRQGFARDAINQLRKIHPGRLLANIAPQNVASQELFLSLGAQMIQKTFELP